MGVVAAWKQGKWVDRMVMVVAVLGFSVPVFVVGYVLAYSFALQLDWFPVQGYTPIAQGLGPWLSNLALPSIALGSAFIALLAKVTGMNFEHMPELKWVFGYPLALGIMTVIDLYLLYKFRKAGWL